MKELDSTVGISGQQEKNGIFGITNKNDTVVITLSGKIDAVNYENIQEAAFKQAESDNVEELVFDMDAVTYVSSAGLRMFSAVNRKTAELGKGYKLVKLREDIMKLFQMTGYSSAFYIEVKEA